MDEDVIGYLRSKGLQVFQAAGHEVTTHCMWCPAGHGGAKGKGKLYVNSETWLFDCKVCGTQGGRKMLMEQFGDVDDSIPLPGANPAAKMRILSEYTDLTADLLLNQMDQLQYLFDRGLSAETVVDYKLGWVPRGMSVTGSLPGDHKIADLKASGMLGESGRDFHSGKITIPYLSRGIALQVRGKDPVGKYFTPPNDNVRLFNQDVLRGAEYVILTEGEFDCLILQQTLRASPNPMHRRYVVVGIAGTQALPGGAEGFPDYFRDAKRVYIGFDQDDAGRKGAVKVKEILGSKSRIIQLPNDHLADSQGKEISVDWTELLRRKNEDHPYGDRTVQDVMGWIYAAEMTGKRIFSAAEAHARWRTERTLTGGIKLGFRSLDALMDPGLFPGNLVIPLAKTGTGKTVLLANIARNLADHRHLHITLENTVTEFFELLWRQHHFFNPIVGDDHLALAMPNLRIVDENKLSPADFAMLIEEYREDVGEPPEVVSVDYLGYYARGQKGGSPYEKASNAVMQLKEEAKAHGIVVISPSQVGRGAADGKAFEGDAARDSGVIEETADLLFALYRPGEAVASSVAASAGMVNEELEAKILKSRRGGKGRVIKLAMSHASLVICDRADSVALQRIQQENAQLNRGVKYPEIYAQQRAVAFRQAQLRVV